MGSWIFIRTVKNDLRLFINTRLNRRINFNHWRPIRLNLVIGIVLASVLVARTSVLPVVAEPGQVEYGRLAEGQITDAVPQQEWAFLPNSKDRITVTVERTSDTLIPTIELHDDNNKVVVRADQDATYARSSISNFTLPSAGRYTLVVGRYNGDTGKTNGKYRLLVTLLGGGEDGFNSTFVQAELQLGQQRDGAVSAAKWRDAWAFRTQNTDPVTITATRIRGTLVPVIVLFDSNWKEVAKGQLDETFAITAITKYIPSASSQYYVVVSRLDGTNGETTGDYRLLVVQGQQ